MTEQEFRSLKLGDPLRYQHGNVRGHVTHCEHVNGTNLRVQVAWQDGHTGTLRLEACGLVHRLPIPKKHAAEAVGNRPSPPRAAAPSQPAGRTTEAQSPAFGSDSGFLWGILDGGMPGANGGGPGFSGGGGDTSGGGAGSTW
ncbi:MAG TPA: hypothetical protein VGD78_15050 [Chthoniobacterales bacterium]